MSQQIIKISLNNYYILQKLMTIEIIWVGYFFLVFNDIHVSLFHTQKNYIHKYFPYFRRIK